MQLPISISVIEKELVSLADDRPLRAVFSSTIADAHHNYVELHNGYVYAYRFNVLESETPTHCGIGSSRTYGWFLIFSVAI